MGEDKHSEGLRGCGGQAGGQSGHIELDIQLALATHIGDGGITADELTRASELVMGAASALEIRRANGELQWMDLPEHDPRPLLAYADEQRTWVHDVLVLGIGGSALGTTALATALLHPYHNLLDRKARQGRPRLFVLDNVDPDQTAGLLELLDPRHTLVNVVSKSGSTAETAAAYLVLRGLLEEFFGSDPDPRGAVRSRLVFTTDPERGALREIASEEGITAFPVPPGVGGRFSVLSAVALLPAALCGIDVTALLAGARAMDQRISSEPGVANPAGLFAAVQFLEYVHYGRNISVLMPYSARLPDLADWYRQLWAESLGKARDRHGRLVHVGPTPVKALGATDQHSQVQLYVEGPDDKIITFISVGDFDHRVPIPALHKDKDSLSYLGNHDLGELMAAELKATAWALARAGRPSLRIHVPRVDASCMGELFFMLEYAAAVMGELLDIDAFDQPGVEAGKRATYALMGRPGFDQVLDELSGWSGGSTYGAGFSDQSANQPTLRPAVRVWLESEGKVFGEGPLRLLEGVRETGSLRQAALRMGMSYNKAWHLIRRLEKKLGVELLARDVGGRGGGGSRLTPSAEELVRRFTVFAQGASQAVVALFRKHFGDDWSEGSNKEGQR